MQGSIVPKWRVRIMAAQDVEEVLRIQRLCYEPEYRELPESYYGRIRLYPRGNVVIEVPSIVDNSPSFESLDDDVSDDDDETTDELSNDSEGTSSPEDSEDEDAGNDSASDSEDYDSKSQELAVVCDQPKTSIKWRMAGYIQAQPFLRNIVNDVNDLTALESWLKEHAQQPQRTSKDVIYIHEIAMDPSFRGQGLTVPLTDYVDQLTAKEGFGMTTLVSLGPALGFWKRNGFILCRDLDYGGHECYYMEKPIVSCSA